MEESEVSSNMIHQEGKICSIYVLNAHAGYHSWYVYRAPLPPGEVGKYRAGLARDNFVS